MQWLTAVLAFATTMLIFAAVVTAMVETIHRMLGSRTIGLQVMLQHYYDRVLQQYLKDGEDFSKKEFVKLMTLARTPIDRKNSAVEGKDAVADDSKEFIDFGKLTRYSFKRLSVLSTETFMERLGSSAFSEHLDHDGSDGDDGEYILKDIAQKFETFGHESSLYFESSARLKSVIVAMLVAWIFYVHPYDLIQTYLRDPAVAQNIANLSEEPLDKYASLVQEAQKLRTEQGKTTAPLPQVTTQEIDQLIEDLNAELTAARSEFDKLSQAGAPVGWPDNPCVAGKADGDCVNTIIWPNKPGKNAIITFNYPSSFQDTFWLLMGGLLIGLGSPFWAKLIGQLSQAQKVTKNISNILKPEGQTQLEAEVSVSTVDSVPVTSAAYTVAANARKRAVNK